MSVLGGDVRTPAAGEFLRVWESALGLGPVERALSLAAATGADVDQLRSRPYGRTNFELLALRESLLGPDLDATAFCPGCGCRGEFSVPVSRLRVEDPVIERTTVESTEYVVGWRVPTPLDLLDLATRTDAEVELRRRCLTATSQDASPGDAEIDPGTLPRELVDLVERTMAQADPMAEVQVAVSCPGCGLEYEVDLDLGAFVWTEVEARAERVIGEVDALARAYGWTEPEILALSEARRAAYLRTVLAGGS